MAGFLLTMADEDEAPPEGETDAAAAEDAGGDDEASAVETTAREQGWAPKEEFRGDPSDWIDADEFVKRGNPQYLRKQLGKSEKQLRELERKAAATEADFNRRLAKMETLNKAQRNKLYADIEAAREAAVEIGDKAEYQRLNKVEAQLYEQEQKAEKAAPAEEKGADKPHPDVERWVSENPWFTKSKALNHAAQGIHAELLDTEPGLTIAENLAKTRAEIIRRFPEKFSKNAAAAKTNGHSAVESGQRTVSTPKGKGFSDIPAEERKVIEGHIKEGLYKDKADAAQAYWS